MSLYRRKAEKDRDYKNIGRLYLQGLAQSEIATQLGISQSTVSRDLQTIQKTWIHDAARDIGERKAQELAKVDALELEYWEAWKRSQENAETRTLKGKGAASNEGPADVEQTVRTEGQVGDPRFLTGIQWCIERRCLILGVDAPKRQEITGKDGEPIKFVKVGIDTDRL